MRATNQPRGPRAELWPRLRATVVSTAGAAICACVAPAATATANPIAVAPVHVLRGLSHSSPLAPERVLFLDGDTAIIRDGAAATADLENLYVVNMSQHFAEPAGLATTGDILAFVPGQLAVMRLTPERAEALSERLHQEGLACGVMTRLTGEPTATAWAAAPAPRIAVESRDERVVRAVAAISEADLKSSVDALARIPSRYHLSVPGRGVAQALAEKYEAARRGRRGVTITPYDHGNKTPQNSLIVRIEGRTRPDEVIVLGSHLDSISGGATRDTNSPGADDNASGTATNLEIFRVLMDQDIQLERTLEIHAYAAEEIGLVGSQDIANAYRKNDVNVIAMVQHDMTLWKAAGAPDKIWFVTANTDNAFNQQLQKLVPTYVGLPFGQAGLTSGSSDHASWRRAGFVTAFPFENPGNYNRHIHTPNDTVANANAWSQAVGFARLGLAYVMHFGGVD